MGVSDEVRIALVAHKKGSVEMIGQIKDGKLIVSIRVHEVKRDR